MVAGESRPGPPPWNRRGAVRADHDRDTGEPLHTGPRLRGEVERGWGPRCWDETKRNFFGAWHVNFFVKESYGNCQPNDRGFWHKTRSNCYLEDHPKVLVRGEDRPGDRQS